uniref:Similar to n=1 Tax=Steinernema glaseri TaxID=37863 RepID=A0A1I7XYX8_9BILA
MGRDSVRRECTQLKGIRWVTHSLRGPTHKALWSSADQNQGKVMPLAPSRHHIDFAPVSGYQNIVRLMPTSFWVEHLLSESCTGCSYYFGSDVTSGLIQRWKEMDPRPLPLKTFLHMDMRSVKVSDFTEFDMKSADTRLLEALKRIYLNVSGREKTYLQCIQHPVHSSFRIYVVLTPHERSYGFYPLIIGMDTVPVAFVESVLQSCGDSLPKGIPHAWAQRGEAYLRERGSLIVTYAPSDPWNYSLPWTFRYKLRGFDHLKERTLSREVIWKIARSITNFKFDTNYKCLWAAHAGRWRTIADDDEATFQLLA